MFEDFNGLFFAIVLLVITGVSFSYCSSDRKLSYEEKMKTLDKLQSAIDKWNGNLPLTSPNQMQDILDTLKK